MRPALTALLVCSSIAAATGALSADPMLTLRVSPTMAREPASLKIVAIVPADDKNRGLEIIAQSADYTRSSHIQLDGRDLLKIQVKAHQTTACPLSRNNREGRA